MFMSGKTVISLNLAEENQNDQLIPQEFGVAITSNLYNPQEIKKFTKNLTIYLYIWT